MESGMWKPSESTLAFYKETEHSYLNLRILNKFVVLLRRIKSNVHSYSPKIPKQQCDYFDCSDTAKKWLILRQHSHLSFLLSKQFKETNISPSEEGQSMEALKYIIEFVWIWSMRGGFVWRSHHMGKKIFFYCAMNMFSSHFFLSS